MVGLEAQSLAPGRESWVPSLKTFKSSSFVPWNHTQPSGVTNGVELVLLLPICVRPDPSLFTLYSLLLVPRK